jgi:peptidoglycan hydrolase-like protein with peptidoglycan-binding domain
LGLWPGKLLNVGCGLLLAGVAAHAQASTTTKESTHQPASHAAKAAVQTSGNTAKAGKSATHTSSRKKRSKKTASWRRRGQQKIDGQRAREIQEALIREHYLTGKASGVWDSASQSAMERYQADNGWQSKTVPDSRALIKLGLGPDHEHLLNPESAMTTAPVSTPSKDDASSPPQR